MKTIIMLIVAVASLLTACGQDMVDNFDGQPRSSEASMTNLDGQTTYSGAVVSNPSLQGCRNVSKFGGMSMDINSLQGAIYADGDPAMKKNWDRVWVCLVQKRLLSCTYANPIVGETTPMYGPIIIEQNFTCAENDGLLGSNSFLCTPHASVDLATQLIRVEAGFENTQAFRNIIAHAMAEDLSVAPMVCAQ